MRTATYPRIARSFAVVIAAVLLFTLIPGGASAQVAPVSERWAMRVQTNDTRTYHGLNRLELQVRLSELARQHSLAMARAGDLFHTRDPEGYYLEGIRWNRWGENVGVTPGTAKDLQKAFMRSSGHRANILNRDFRQVAIGAVRVDGLLWVTVFFFG
jgi:uncharacterized protein YkwD